jgi:hypothetical protein
MRKMRMISVEEKVVQFIFSVCSTLRDKKNRIHLGLQVKLKKYAHWYQQ